MARATSTDQIETGAGFPLESPLVGHETAARSLLEAIHGGRMHHAWLLHGPQGIGKARFAAQAAAYLVAEKARLGRETLDIDLSHPDARLLAQGAHPDVHVLDRTIGAGGKKLPKVIPVGDVRATLQSLQTTAAYGGWRALIVDALDDLNIEGANALLKPLEEPAKDTALFLVAHAVNRVLPTIRSRCRHLAFRPLTGGSLRSIDAPSADDNARQLAAVLSGGRVGQVLRLAGSPDVLEAYRTFCELAAKAGQDGGTGKTAERLTFAALVSGLTDEDRTLLLGLIEDWLSRRVRGLAEPASLATPGKELRLDDQEAIGRLWSEHMAAIDVRRAINLDLSERIMTLFAQLDQVYRQV